MSNIPLLSICMFGRNDDYMPDFLYRLSMTINFIAHSCERIGRLGDIEIVVTDWKSHMPLVDAVELTEQGAGITRFLYVEPTEQKHDSIPLCLAMNTALRNAAGTYLAMCGADAIIPSSSLAALFDVIEGRSLYTTAENKAFICGRYTIPYTFVRSQPGIDEWERYLRVNSWQIEQDRAMGGFLSGGAGFLMFHRDLIWASGGLNEQQSAWGWSDIDLTLRFMGQHASYDLRSAGVVVYDMQHEPKMGGRAKAITYQAPHYIPRDFSVNGATWGEPQAKIRLMPAYSRFDRINESKKCFNYIANLNDLSVRRTIVEFLEETKAGRTNRQEALLLLILSDYANQKVVFRYFEHGINQGVHARFMAYLYKWVEIYGCGQWDEIDDNLGPHNIARLLYERPIGHRGCLRLINNTLSGALNVLAQSFDGEFKLDVAVVHEADETETSAIESLLMALDAGGILVYMAETHDAMHRIKECAESLGEFRYRENVDLRILVIGRGIDGSLGVSDHIMMEFPQVRNWAYQSVTNFYRSLCEIPQGMPIVLYGFGSVAKLALPHIRDRVIAIIDETLNKEGVDSVDDIKVITPENLTEYRNALVVVTPVIYREQIMQALEQYDNRVFCLYM